MHQVGGFQPPFDLVKRIAAIVDDFQLVVSGADHLEFRTSIQLVFFFAARGFDCTFAGTTVEQTGFAVALSENPVGIADALFDVGRRSFCAIVRELLVVFCAAAAIGVRAQFHHHAAILVHDRNNFIQFCGGVRPDVVFVQVEIDGVDGHEFR